MKTKDYAEIIGIGAVVASLLMLTYELRQNTIASQQAAAATYSEAWRDIELFSAGNHEFTSILLKGINGERDQLTAVEIFRLDFFYRTVFRSWQNSYLQYRAGSLPEEIWNAEVRFMSELVPMEKGMQSYWQYEKGLYSDVFVELFDSLIPDIEQ
jgi:hypothetical protein